MRGRCAPCRRPRRRRRSRPPARRRPAGAPRLTSRRKSTACRQPSRSSPGRGRACPCAGRRRGRRPCSRREQGVDGEVDAAALVEAQVDAEGADLVDLALQHVVRHAVVGDADAQHAAGHRQRLEDRGLVAVLRQVAGRRHAGRAAADDGDLLVEGDRQLLGQLGGAPATSQTKRLRLAMAMGSSTLPRVQAVSQACAQTRPQTDGNGLGSAATDRRRRSGPRGSGRCSPGPRSGRGRRSCRARSPACRRRRCWGSPAGRACRSPCARRAPRCTGLLTVTGQTGTHSPQLVHISGSTKRALWWTVAVKSPGSPSRPVSSELVRISMLRWRLGLDQLGRQRTHRAVVGGERLVELGHVAAQGGRLVDEVDLVAAFGQVE